MQHAQVLDIAAAADAGGIDVAAQHGQRPDAGAFGQADIADHDGLRVDIDVGCQCGQAVLEGAQGHGGSFCLGLNRQAA